MEVRRLDIEPLVVAPGWDTMDEVKANMKNWGTRSFPDIRLKSVIQSIRAQERSFAAAAVPQGQATVEEKAFLTSFLPLPMQNEVTTVQAVRKQAETLKLIGHDALTAADLHLGPEGGVLR